MRTIHAIVKGRVQGVFFRDYTFRYAQQCGVTGWVKNLSDGCVEALIHGETEKVSQMVTWLHTGSPSSHVTEVKTKETTVDPVPTTFTIRY